jgi:hypothetical protein
MLVARRDVVASIFRLFRPTPFMLAEITVERYCEKKIGRNVSSRVRGGIAEERTGFNQSV